MNEAIHRHYPSDEKAVLFERRYTVSGTCRSTRATVTVNRGYELFEKRNKKASRIIKSLGFLGEGNTGLRPEKKQKEACCYGYTGMDTTFKNTHSPVTSWFT